MDLPERIRHWSDALNVTVPAARWAYRECGGDFEKARHRLADLTPEDHGTIFKETLDDTAEKGS